jgi:hypothetical protein
MVVTREAIIKLHDDNDDDDDNNNNNNNNNSYSYGVVSTKRPMYCGQFLIYSASPSEFQPLLIHPSELPVSGYSTVI